MDKDISISIVKLILHELDLGGIEVDEFDNELIDKIARQLRLVFHKIGGMI